MTTDPYLDPTAGSSPVESLRGEKMPITSGDKENFNTLLRAASNNDLCILQTKRKAGKSEAIGEEVILICAVNTEGDNVVGLVPLASLMRGNPFETFVGPNEALDLPPLEVLRSDAQEVEGTPEESDPQQQALKEFVGTVEAAGGLFEGGPLPVPKADPGWVDLAQAYLRACEALGKEPMIEKEEEVE